MSNNAKCRWCGRKLIGKPYYLGGNAYIPETMKKCKVNHYGGYVCSRECDWNASLSMHRSMPGCHTATRPDDYALQRIRSNWDME